MRFICIAATALLLHSCQRKTIVHTVTVNSPVFTDTKGNPMLLGTHTKQDLQQAPYAGWFDKNYSEYTIDTVTINGLKPLIKNKRFEIFMGTWCGDSKREVPRMFKILEYAGVKASDIRTIMVDDHDSSYKQSPAHEEKGKFIYRVPDLLVYENNNELNRIVEYPVVSIEKDLLAIVNKEIYQPHYKAAACLANLIAGKDIAAVRKDSIHVVATLKSMSMKAAELNSLGNVWMAAGEWDKALLVFEINAALYPAEGNVYHSLGQFYMKLNNKEMAAKYYRKVLELEPGNANAVRMLGL